MALLFLVASINIHNKNKYILFFDPNVGKKEKKYSQVCYMHVINKINKEINLFILLLTYV